MINGDHPGRQDDAQITLFDETCVGLQDLVTAARVVELAVEAGTVQKIDL